MYKVDWETNPASSRYGTMQSNNPAKGREWEGGWDGRSLREKTGEPHMGGKLSRWKTPPHSHSSHRIHSSFEVLRCIHTRPRGSNLHPLKLHKSCNLKGCQAIRRCSVLQPKHRAVTLHTYAHGRKAHATVLDAPHTPGYCSYAALTHGSPWHSLGPVLAQALPQTTHNKKGR